MTRKPLLSYGSLKVDVVPADYPEGKLSDEKGNEVVNILEGVIDTTPDRAYFPGFLNNWFLRGADRTRQGQLG